MPLDGAGFLCGCMCRLSPRLSGALRPIPWSAAMPASAAGNFFECLDGIWHLGMVLRSGRELAQTHCAQFAAQGLL